MYDVTVISPRIQYFRPKPKFKVTIHLVSDLYTWFPFTNGQCDQCMELSFLDTWTDEPNGQFQYDRNLFPQKIPNTFSKCPLIFHPHEELYTGRTNIEWIILNATFTSLNVTLICIKNKTYHDAFLLGMLGNTIKIWYYLNGEDNFMKLSITQPHIYSDFKVFVHCPKKHVLYGNFHKVFKSSLWVLFFVTCIISSVVNYIIHKTIRFELSDFREISYNFYFIWSILTSVSVPKIPRITRVRLFFVLLLFYALLMSTIFQSFFTSFLTEPVMERGIANIEELIRNNLTVFSENEIILAAFSDFSINGASILNFGGITIQISNNSIENFLNIENSAVLTTEMDMKFKISSRMRLEKPCSFNFHSQTTQSVLFQGFSPFQEAFNFKIMRSFESGLFIKYLDDYISSDININGTLTGDKIRRYEQEEYFAIDLQHLRIVFYIHLFGMAVSIFVFIFEIVFIQDFKYSSL
ncbi:hypothetical protein L9F63_022526 [Diploptera punctata]|uniref:Ionotropic glutamate receptor C-terminal domain-containing protein n=1 Tax=Diploptera punctata TaxID=6984 RepID=A0AAD7ZM10_DIPPU|nr:hypothetical protein L9F63_022526 [Diploptera punctata]